MMKKLILIVLLCLVSGAASATTWYVRSDGGSYGTSSTTCNGLYDDAYTGGDGPNCAVKSIYEIHQWYSDPALTLRGTARVSGGDEVIFSKPSDSFPIGANRTTTPASCSSSSPYDCNLAPFPDGSSGDPTRILGYGYDNLGGCPAATMVELYGDQGASSIFRTHGHDWVEFNCLDITDHSNCGFRTGANDCAENYPADVGAYARDGFSGHGGSNQTYKYVKVHGMALRAFNVGDVTNLTLDHVDMDGNHYGGWDGDVSPIGASTSLVDGTITLTHVNVRFNGCAEAYPPSASFDHDDYDDCTDQNDSGYGDGFGFLEVDGTFLMDNSNVSWNSSDGLDLLYEAFDTVKIDKSRFEGNIGNQVKVLTTNLDFTNNVSIANCEYHDITNKIHNTGTFVTCRANGSFVVVPMAGGVYRFYNNTIVSATHTGGSAAIEGADTNSTANGTETYLASNNIYYSPNATWTLYYNGVPAGGAATDWNAFSTDHSIIYNFQSNPCPSGTGNQCNTNPNFSGTISGGSEDNLSAVYLQSGGNAVGAGVSGNTFWNDSNDFNNFPQNSPIDVGALQFGSVPSEGGGGGGSSTGINAYITGKASLTGGRIQ